MIRCNFKQPGDKSQNYGEFRYNFLSSCRAVAGAALWDLLVVVGDLVDPVPEEGHPRVDARVLGLPAADAPGHHADLGPRVPVTDLHGAAGVSTAGVLAGLASAQHVVHDAPLPICMGPPESPLQESLPAWPAHSTWSMMPPGAAGPYVSLHSLLSQIFTVISCRMSGWGPFSLRLPQPTTVAVWPTRAGPPYDSRQTGRTFAISGTSSVRVMIATSLCRVCWLNSLWRTTLAALLSNSWTLSLLVLMAWSPSLTFRLAT